MTTCLTNCLADAETYDRLADEYEPRSWVLAKRYRDHARRLRATADVLRQQLEQATVREVVP